MKISVLTYAQVLHVFDELVFPFAKELSNNTDTFHQPHILLPATAPSIILEFGLVLECLLRFYKAKFCRLQ